jgi:site-specific recombinase XerC
MIKKEGDEMSALRSLVEDWLHDLKTEDCSAHTHRLYRSCVLHFLAWYAHQEQRPVTLADLTPIALLQYRHALQHRQNKATSTVNAHLTALRSWSAWLSDQQQVALNPAARLHFLTPTTTAPQGLPAPAVHA